MNTQIKLTLTLAACMVAFTSSLFAQLAIPSDGSDGALVISNNTVIDLRLAVTGNWTNNNSANAGKGIYDPEKWAVVFKYSSVVISNGATLTFTNHPTHAPVVWLVTNNVTINGGLSLDGQLVSGNLGIVPEGGPGGFRGGAINEGTLGHGGGFGPGGYYHDWGSYSTNHSYGNQQIVPLIGGSGGSAGYNDGNNNDYNGGGGGGAILIAASGIITVNGYCHANGGYDIANGRGFNWSYSGSGGAIRLVANQILGNGRIEASQLGNQVGSPGRIRLEANTASGLLGLNPLTIAVSPTPLVIWPDVIAPTVKVISVAALAAPSDPLAQISAAGDDFTIAKTNAVAIVLQTANFPTNGTVNVYIKPRNAAQSILPASFVSGNSNAATWQLNTILPVSHTVIQARAVAP